VAEPLAAGKGAARAGAVERLAAGKVVDPVDVLGRRVVDRPVCMVLVPSKGAVRKLVLLGPVPAISLA